MNDDQIETVIVTTLARVLKCDVNHDASRETLPQWDSLKHIEVIFELEDRLGVQFSEGEMAELDSVEKIVSKVMARHEA